MDEKRAAVIIQDILDGLRGVIRRHGVTYPEYRQAVSFLAAAGERGELPLLCDVLLETVVDENAAGTPGTTDSNVEGPFFAAGAPTLEPDGDGLASLPMRANEPGDRLVFSGVVRSTGGEPLPGAVLDVWQADGTGAYSGFAPGLPEWNLRGRVSTDNGGRFSILTVVPLAYDIPGEPHTARVLELLGLEPHRPAHIHVRLESPGYAPLTTQVYFAGDPWLEHDVVGAARPSLVTKLEPAAVGGSRRPCRGDTPHPPGRPGGAGFACRFDFTLAPAG
ncbi:MAG: catechol 1,2-dioxygenase [Actinobacteria bacterium]|nr:catechol 1,2-dioxygenase [Actinomycetota bacterium]